MSKLLLCLVYYRKQVLQGDIWDSCGVPIVSDSRHQRIIHMHFHPEEVAHCLLEHGWNLVGDDQMELRLLSLGFEGLCRGKNYVSPGALLADVESEYFPVHLRLYSHQYAYYYCHERSAPFVHEKRSMPHGGHRDRSRLLEIIVSKKGEVRYSATTPKDVLVLLRFSGSECRKRGADDIARHDS